MMIVVMTAVMITFEMTILLITAEEPIQITAKKMHDTNNDLFFLKYSAENMSNRSHSHLSTINSFS